MTDQPLTNENLAQHLQALQHGNEIRFARAADKRRIKRRELDAALVLRDPGEHWRRAALMDLLLSIPKVGRVKAQKWCSVERVRLETRIEDLTPRQREMMARQIEFHTDAQFMR